MQNLKRLSKHILKRTIAQSKFNYSNKSVKLLDSEILNDDNTNKNLKKISKDESKLHIPVMLNEVIQHLVDETPQYKVIAKITFFSIELQPTFYSII